MRAAGVGAKRAHRDAPNGPAAAAAADSAAAAAFTRGGGVVRGDGAQCGARGVERGARVVRESGRVAQQRHKRCARLDEQRGAHRQLADRAGVQRPPHARNPLFS